MGFNITNGNKFYHIKNTIDDIKIRSNVILNNFNNVDTKSKVKIYNSQCLSLYGCCLWDIKSNELNDLVVAWRKCCRRILNLPSRTHNKLISHLMDTKDIFTVIEERIINFCIAGFNHENSLISNIFKNSILLPFSYYGSNFNIITRKYHLDKFKLISENKRVELKNNNIEDKWKVDFIKQLMDDRDSNEENILSKHELKDILDFLCTS